MSMLCRVLIVFAIPAVCASAGQAQAPPIPPHLPRYIVDVTLDDSNHTARLHQTITWTNPQKQATDQIVLNFYPLYQLPRSDKLLIEKTIELLRLKPEYGIDKHAVPAKVHGITLGGRMLSYHYRNDNVCAVIVQLPAPVECGQSVTLEFDATICLPHMQGRWGHWNGVQYLTNALPTVAYYDEASWHDVPFVPWHQPFWNEAGHYQTTITVSNTQKVACSGEIVREEDIGNGMKRIITKPFLGRDFAILSSARFQEFCSTTQTPAGRTIRLKCLAFPQHEFYAKEMLRIVGEAIPIYSKWLGEFPYDQFTVVESYFGWNGNECGGLIMIDERVFDAPHVLNGYVEYLVSHEVCHQWWYNLVGTNGYSETFMDEGLATFFTHRLLDAKHGRNNKFVQWPIESSRLPNIHRDNYRNSSIYGAIRRHDAPAAAGDLDKFGNLVRLFSGAYDRGSKVFGMIEERLGPEFIPFIQSVVKKYSWKVLSAEQFKQELIAFTGPQSAAGWDDFFQRWVYLDGLVDWKVKEVRINDRVGGPFHRLRPIGPPKTKGPAVVEVVIAQQREYNEPTVVGFQFALGDGYPVRIPIGPLTQAHQLSECDAEVRPLENGELLVRVTLPAEPIQIEIDPDRVLLDANPANNRWKADANFRFPPLYTMLSENALTNDYDRWNFAIGGWFWGPFYQDPWYTRATMLGARFGAYRSDIFTGGAYVAYRTDFSDIVAGVDGLIDHWPFPRTQVGYNFEQRIGGPYNGDGEEAAQRATLFGRYVFQYTSSLYLHPMHYVEAYTTYQDNFLPTVRNVRPPDAVRPTYTWMSGLHHRLNLYTPYWNPDHGVWVDLVAAGGIARMNNVDRSASQFRGEFAMVHELGEGFGYLSRVRAAGRVMVHSAFPNEGEFYAMGGSQYFRGYDFQERQGSLFWLANAELRMPIVEDVRWNILDRFFGVRGVTGAAFYDVGNIYVNNKSVGGTAHALGVGLRFDIAVASFIERATLRFDVAKTINDDTPFQFWFGIQNPF